MHCEECKFDLCLDCGTLPTCTSNHKYAMFEKKVPEYEEWGKDPKCRVCKSTELKKSMFFYHCSMCEEEICFKCMQEKAGRPIKTWLYKRGPEYADRDDQ